MERATSPFSAATCRRKLREAGSLPQQASGLFYPKVIYQTCSWRDYSVEASRNGRKGRKGRQKKEISTPVIGPRHSVTRIGKIKALSASRPLREACSCYFPMQKSFVFVRMSSCPLATETVERM